MKYVEYMELGFKRKDINDGVLERQTGYPGYNLLKKLTNEVSIETTFSDLSDVKLYIEYEPGSFYIIKLTDEQVKLLIETKKC